MSLEIHKQKSREVLQLWSSSDTGTHEELLARNYVNHQEPDVHGGTSERDLERYAELLREFHHAFSEAKPRILAQIAEGNLVATRWQLTAKHTSEYMGLPPTNKEISWSGIQIDRYEGERIVESWVDWDKYGMLAQLGAMKGPH